uniref:Translation initiation factor eIF2B subunit gamma n=1 Tax=Dunaliella tertiolecta TaxID=3047 RepID=A0A7S3R0R7_DUNTE|mmetsp:Transcript_18577/g.52201  ORF Transcript_18577/g.52201 Transcript_18577/m.52201 type:complete len:475 (+) Transcript_18577:22-1446(+)
MVVPQAIVLAGGEDKTLFPLTCGTAKALLPVSNRALVSYPLKSLHKAGLKHAIVVVAGERAAASVQAWVHHEYAEKDLVCEVVCVPEEYGTADALRTVAPRVTTPTCVVISGDLITDVQIDVLVATHQLSSALVTMALYKRKVSPSSESKPGKAPKNVDYVGLDPRQEHLLFYASSPEALRDLKVPLSVVKRHGSITVASNLTNAQLYIMNRCVLDLLVAQPQLTSLRKDVLPYLALNQRRLRQSLGQKGSPGAAAERDSHAVSADGGGEEDTSSPDQEDESSDNTALHSSNLPGADYMEWSHTPASEVDQGACFRVNIVQPGSNYCARASDAVSYGEVNRETADSSVALHLTGHAMSPQHDNVVPHSTSIGSKASVASGCVLGEGCVLGDKASIKRSVLGRGCRLGVSTKVINSVLQDGIVIGDGCTIQNSIICSDVQIKEKAQLKDCQVGKGYVLSGDQEYNGEVLSKTPKP